MARRSSPPPDPTPPPVGLTRRALFQGAGAAAAASAFLRTTRAAAEESAETTVRTQGPGAVDVVLRVNGSERKVSVEPRHTLLDVLRLDLDLTGAKPVCERSQCGACTIWLDGRTVNACSVLAVEGEGHELTTIEGLGTPQSMHPVQAAFVREDALQCGFCTPGMVMSAAWALKTHGPGATSEQIASACAGNLCRCGTYPHVLKAALRAARGE